MPHAQAPEPMSDVKHKLPSVPKSPRDDGDPSLKQDDPPGLVGGRLVLHGRELAKAQNHLKQVLKTSVPSLAASPLDAVVKICVAHLSAHARPRTLETALAPFVKDAATIVLDLWRTLGAEDDSDGSSRERRRRRKRRRRARRREEERDERKRRRKYKKLSPERDEWATNSGSESDDKHHKNRVSRSRRHSRHRINRDVDALVSDGDPTERSRFESGDDRSRRRDGHRRRRDRDRDDRPFHDQRSSGFESDGPSERRRQPPQEMDTDDDHGRGRDRVADGNRKKDDSRGDRDREWYDNDRRRNKRRHRAADGEGAHPLPRGEENTSPRRMDPRRRHNEDDWRGDKGRGRDDWYRNDRRRGIDHDRYRDDENDEDSVVDRDGRNKRRKRDDWERPPSPDRQWGGSDRRRGDHRDDRDGRFASGERREEDRRDCDRDLNEDRDRGRGHNRDQDEGKAHPRGRDRDRGNDRHRERAADRGEMDVENDRQDIRTNDHKRDTQRRHDHERGHEQQRDRGPDRDRDRDRIPGATNRGLDNTPSWLKQHTSAKKEAAAKGTDPGSKGVPSAVPDEEAPKAPLPSAAQDKEAPGQKNEQNGTEKEAGNKQKTSNVENPLEGEKTVARKKRFPGESAGQGGGTKVEAPSQAGSGGSRSRAKDNISTAKLELLRSKVLKSLKKPSGSADGEAPELENGNPPRASN